MKPYVPRKQHRLHNENGQIAANFTEDQQGVKAHFAKALDGTMCSKRFLIELDRADAVARAVKFDSTAKTLRAV